VGDRQRKLGCLKGFTVKKKIISVVIPTFNRVAETKRAIESVQSKYPDLVEVVVVDDGGSTTYRYDDPCNRSGIDVRVLRRERNSGAGISRMFGVAAANGSLIAFLDSDDEYSPGWLDAILMDFMHGADRGGRQIIYVGQTQGGAGLYVRALDLIARGPFLSSLSWARLISVFFNPFYTPSIAMTRDICMFHRELRYCEDYFTNVMATFSCQRVVILDTLASKLGRMPNSGGGLSNARRKMFLGELRVRIDLLRSNKTSFFYKPLIVLGVGYQMVRTVLKLNIFLRRKSG